MKNLSPIFLSFFFLSFIGCNFRPSLCQKGEFFEEKIVSDLKLGEILGEKISKIFLENPSHLFSKKSFKVDTVFDPDQKKWFIFFSPKFYFDDRKLALLSISFLPNKERFPILWFDFFLWEDDPIGLKTLLEIKGKVFPSPQNTLLKALILSTSRANENVRIVFKQCFPPLKKSGEIRQCKH